jgi:hypothetical protein
MNQMELPKEELERMMFFEEARLKAEMDHKANPKDAQVGAGASGGRRGARFWRLLGIHVRVRALESEVALLCDGNHCRRWILRARGLARAI